jgi:hypothetical protein
MPLESQVLYVIYHVVMEDYVLQQVYAPVLVIGLILIVQLLFVLQVVQAVSNVWLQMYVDVLLAILVLLVQHQSALLLV